MIGITSWPKEIKAQQEKAVAVQQLKKEKTNFAYIDAAVLDRVKEDNTPRQTEKQKAKEASRAIVAGFPVFDPDMEKDALDKLIANRNKQINTFIADRHSVVEKLKAIGIQTLAVVPKLAWAEICSKTGLVVMIPDKDGNVTISSTALARFGSKAAAEAAAKKDHAAYVRALFPKVPESGMKAKVVLPNPPEDVAAILLKAKKLGLNVAAVPEAIRFVQTPSELYDRATIDPRDEWARRQGYADYKDWVKRDPIVFHDHGTASAIIAQFGDFPIEKDVVDSVMAMNDLIPDSPSQAGISPLPYANSDMNDAYIQQAQAEMMRRINDAAFGGQGRYRSFGSGIGGGFAGTGTISLADLVRAQGRNG